MRRPAPPGGLLAAAVAGALTLAAAGCGAAEPGTGAAGGPPPTATAAAMPAPAGDGSWRRAPLWDDGKAELCAYDVTWARYGRLWPGRALLVLVKEPWAPDLDVKADQPRPDGFDVLKLNHVRDVPTGIYAYHQMASAFLRRDDGALVKLATTSSEACGISTALLAGGTLDTRSYFDGQGNRSTAYPAGALPEDALPALLRDYVEGEAPATLSVFPSLLTGRFPDLVAASYRLSRRPLAEVAVPGGTAAGVELRLERGDHFLSYAFAAEAPHRLLRLSRDDGTEYRLAKCERLAYWTMNVPGGEGWYPDGLR
jgi:hypothetical protein